MKTLSAIAALCVLNDRDPHAEAITPKAYSTMRRLKTNEARSDAIATGLRRMIQPKINHQMLRKTSDGHLIK